MLQVLPKEAETLALVQKTGQLHVSLRNPEDFSTLKKVEPTTPAKILQPERQRKLLEQRRKTIVRFKSIRFLPGPRK